MGLTETCGKTYQSIHAYTVEHYLLLVVSDFRVFGVSLDIQLDTSMLLIGGLLGARPDEGGTIYLFFILF